VHKSARIDLSLLLDRISGTAYLSTDVFLNLPSRSAAGCGRHLFAEHQGAYSDCCFTALSSHCIEAALVKMMIYAENALY